MELEYRYFLNSQLGEIELDHNPIGWDGAENILSRSKDFKGVFSNYSLNALEFTGNGKKHLVELESLEGINMICTVSVRKRSSRTKQYTTIYFGVLNGKTYNELGKYGGCVSINIGESSVYEKLLARSKVNINYDDNFGIDGNALPIYDTKYSNVSVSGNEIITSGTVKFEEGSFYTGFSGSQANIVAIPSVLIESNNPNVFSPNFYGLVFIEKIGQGGWWYQTGNRRSIVEISFNAKMYTELNLGVRLIWAVGDILPIAEDAVDPDYLENITTKHEIFLAGGEYDIATQLSETFTVTVGANQALFLYCLSGQSGPNIYVTYRMDENSTSINFSELPSTKTIQGIRSDLLFERLILSLVGEETVTVKSNILKESGSEHNNLLAFNGYMARGYSQEQSRFSTNLDDFFNTFGILVNGGLGITELEDSTEVSFESLDEFYLDDIAITIDNVELETWDRKIDPSLFFTACECGYDKTEYEEESGLIEYNNRSEFATSVSKTDGILSLMPTYRLDGYGLTYAVEKSIEENETTDTQYDKSNFVLDCLNIYTNAYSQKGKSDFSVVEGIDKIKIPINLNYTPLRLLKRNSEQLTTGFEKISATEIKFTTSDVLNNLGTRKASEYVTYYENGNVPVGNLKDARFSGFLIKFAYAMTLEQFGYIKEHKYERWEVKNPDTGKYHYGWISEVEQTLDKKVNIILMEQNNGYNPERQAVMVDHNAAFIVTDKNFKISVNE